MIHSEFEHGIRKALESLSLFLKGCCDHLDNFLFKQRLRQAGLDNTGKIPTWTKKRELMMLHHLASSLPRGALALEIGSYLGASTCYLAAGLAQIGGHLFCIDTWYNETMPDGVRDTFADFQKNTRGIHSHITPVRKKSSELHLADIRVPLHLIFIDGDHSYAAVKSDFRQVRNWLAQDGIIVFHDCSNSDYEAVSRVVGEALASGHWMILGFCHTLVWLRRAKNSSSFPPGCRQPQ